MSEDQEPRWLTALQVLEIHDHALAGRGGVEGVKDLNALESAVARPQQFYHYEGERDLSMLAALYSEGIINNHAFNDGNKRTGYLAGDVFLSQNGRELQPARDLQERATFFVNVAQKEVSRDELAQFYRDNSIERERQRDAGERTPEETRAATKQAFRQRVTEERQKSEREPRQDRGQDIERE